MPGKPSVENSQNQLPTCFTLILNVPRWNIPPALKHSRKVNAKPHPHHAITNTKRLQPYPKGCKPPTVGRSSWPVARERPTPRCGSKRNLAQCAHSCCCHRLACWLKLCANGHSQPQCRLMMFCASAQITTSEKVMTKPFTP